MHLNKEIAKKRPQMKIKVLFHQDNAPCHKSIANVKTTWITLQIASAPILFSRSGPSDYWLFADLKRMLQGKRFSSSEEVILETEVYFEAKDKSFHKKGIE